VAGVFAGALAVGVLLYATFATVANPPEWAFAALTAALALVTAGLIPIHLDGSPWRVPQSWHRLGPVGYPAAFGVALGTGFATQLSSPAAYLVLVWPTVAPGWTQIWPVFAAFAAGRALPFLAVAIRSAQRRSYPADQLEPIATATRSLPPVEAFIMASIAAWLLASG
jgi:hypothetical protein